MTERSLGILRFEEGYFERIWGGRRLGAGAPSNLFEGVVSERQELNTLPSTPPSRRLGVPRIPIGEAWLVSDHPSHESRVRSGPHAGHTLRQLLEDDATAILGTRAALTIHGRFPLLLKLLDTQDYLSVQVHPDDECARRLNEPDIGKTEMWYVLEAAPGSELVCGLRSGVTRETFAKALETGRVPELMLRLGVKPGSAVFVPAGAVHAIGPGILLAEIQQNSDLTYRIYEWGRVGADGKPRELHVDKALAAIHFGSAHGGASNPLAYDHGGNRCTVLAACRHFAAELVEVSASYRRNTRRESFYILLGVGGRLKCRAGDFEEDVGWGEAVLVPACFDHFTVEGSGRLLEYYVPDLQRDIVAPLLAAGHGKEETLLQAD